MTDYRSEQKKPRGDVMGKVIEFILLLGAIVVGIFLVTKAVEKSNTKDKEKKK